MKTRKVHPAFEIARKLAAMSDREIARLLRKPELRPRRRRPSRRQQAPAWTVAKDQLLGKWPDVSVAHYLGRTLKGVQGRRQKLGLIKQVHIPWTPEEIRLLDPAADQGTRPPMDATARQYAGALGRLSATEKEIELWPA